MSGQSRIRRFRTWVKVDGVYPGPVPCEGHRSKDRMILAIGAVKRIDGSRVPVHTVSIEMGPVLKHFRDLTDELEAGELPLDDEHPCDAQLHRGELVIGTCSLRADHDGDHLEVGCPEPLENWPPRARVRWTADVTSFHRYDPTDEPTWKWEDDDIPTPTLDWTFTGIVGPGVSPCKHRYDGHWIGRRIALPDLGRFMSHHRDLDPLILFLHWVASELGGIPEGKLLNSARLYLVPVNHDELIRLERFWSERLTGDPTDAWVEELNYAPMPLGSDTRVPRWAAKGFLYVAAGAIRRTTSQDC